MRPIRDAPIGCCPGGDPLPIDQGRQRIRGEIWSPPDRYRLFSDSVVSLSDLHRFRKVATPFALIPFDVLPFGGLNNEIANPGAVQVTQRQQIGCHRF